MRLEPPIIIRYNAIAACCAVVIMLGLYLATGIGQDPLQFVHAPADYLALLLAHPPLLRGVIGIDNLFIVFYTSVFVALALVLLETGARRALVGVALALLLALALLDYGENLHFLVMLAQAEQGLAPSAGRIGWQVLESLFKFHLSYLGLFVLGLALPRRTAGERLLANLSLFVQLPVGVAIYVAPAQWSYALVFVRFAYFVGGLALIAVLYGSASPRRAPTVSHRRARDGADGSGVQA